MQLPPICVQFSLHFWQPERQIMGRHFYITYNLPGLKVSPHGWSTLFTWAAWCSCQHVKFIDWKQCERFKTYTYATNVRVNQTHHPHKVIKKSPTL